LKVAVPTDDGSHIARRFGRARAFVITHVAKGQIGPSEVRENPMSMAAQPTKPILLHHRRRALRPHQQQTLIDVLADCRAVIVSGIGDPLRRMLFSRGIEVVFTSEDLVDRVLALFSVGALRDESRTDPTFENDEDTPDVPKFGTPDDYDA